MSNGNIISVKCFQTYTGVWVDDILKCGELEDTSRESAPRPTEYPIPTIELAHTESVIQEARETFTAEV